MDPLNQTRAFIWGPIIVRTYQSEVIGDASGGMGKGSALPSPDCGGQAPWPFARLASHVERLARRILPRRSVRAAAQAAPPRRPGPSTALPSPFAPAANQRVGTAPRIRPRRRLLRSFALAPPWLPQPSPTTTLNPELASHAQVRNRKYSEAGSASRLARDAEARDLLCSGFVLENYCLGPQHRCRGSTAVRHSSTEQSAALPRGALPCQASTLPMVCGEPRRTVLSVFGNAGSRL